MILKYRWYIISLFVILSAFSGYYATKLKFTFSFEQFFPQGDPDLAFYKDFIKDFESDDNFLLIAIENKPTVFDSVFLERFHKFSIELRNLPYINKTQSLTQLKYPVKTPFGYQAFPVIHLDEPARYEEDKRKILSDERFVYNLIDSTATSIVVAAKTKQDINIDESRTLTDSLDEMITSYGFQNKAHILGRAYFQRSLVDFQKSEMTMAFLMSILLVTIVMILIYRKPIGIIISLTSIALGLLLFVGYLGFMGVELNAIAALFPVIMLIVGSSDVIHIFSKYVDELNHGKPRTEAMNITIKEIGLATFMTSLTTAIGFGSLMMSKLKTIQDFGFNAAIGVLIAYITVILFTTSVLSLFNRDKIIRDQYEGSRWDRWLLKVAAFIPGNINRIFASSILLVIACIAGMSMISTNYNIEDNLPRGSKVTEDFKYFEKNYAGFRPLEFAITTKGDNRADDYLVVKEISKLEDKINATGVVKSTLSLATFYKSMHKMNNANAESAYIFPATEEEYLASQKLLERISKDEATILVSKDGNKTRISSRITDIGADKIKVLTKSLDQWIATNIDTSLFSVKQTGTGMILDKNSEYVTKSLLQGLGISILIISILMGFLFKSLRMLIIAMIPNLIPLLFAAGMIGYCGIELEAGVSIIFAIIFGIAVDDSIHFLGRYKLCLINGKTQTEAVQRTLQETGKAIIFTSILLFFGFFNMIFSVNPPTFAVGLLISVTLISAVICDLILLPALIIRFMK